MSTPYFCSDFIISLPQKIKKSENQKYARLDVFQYELASRLKGTVEKRLAKPTATLLHCYTATPVTAMTSINDVETLLQDIIPQ